MNSRWPHYNTVIENVFIYHKSEVGYTDRTFSGAAEKIVVLEKQLSSAIGDLTNKGLSLVKTGKSAALRIKVPPIDFSMPFDRYCDEISKCFEAIKKMTNLAKELSTNRNIMETLK